MTRGVAHLHVIRLHHVAQQTHNTSLNQRLVRGRVGRHVCQRNDRVSLRVDVAVVEASQANHGLQRALLHNLLLVARVSSQVPDAHRGVALAQRVRRVQGGNQRRERTAGRQLRGVRKLRRQVAQRAASFTLHLQRLRLHHKLQVLQRAVGHHHALVLQHFCQVRNDAHGLVRQLHVTLTGHVHQERQRVGAHDSHLVGLRQRQVTQARRHFTWDFNGRGRQTQQLQQRL